MTVNTKTSPENLKVENTPTVKVITWATNYNNKLGCNAMVHIDIKPVNVPKHKDFENIVFEIVTKDGSYPPGRYLLLDMLFFELNQLPDQLALASHGITAMELVEEFFKKYPTWINLKTPMALYYYKRIF